MKIRAPGWLSPVSQLLISSGQNFSMVRSALGEAPHPACSLLGILPQIIRYLKATALTLHISLHIHCLCQKSDVPAAYRKCDKGQQLRHLNGFSILP